MGEKKMGKKKYSTRNGGRRRRDAGVATARRLRHQFDGPLETGGS